MDWPRVTEVAEKYREKILSLPGVVGMSTGVQRGASEPNPCIRVYLCKPLDRGDLADGRIPLEIEGVPVEVVVTGDIVAL